MFLVLDIYFYNFLNVYILCNQSGGELMDLPENVQAGLANVNAKADIKAEVKAADTINNQFGGTTNVDNSNQQIIHQNFNIAILPNIHCNDAIQKAFLLGNDNASIVGADVQKMLSDNNVTDAQIQDKLSNPEILLTLAEANKIAYTTNDIEKRKILSDLIYSKISTEETETSNTLSLAIKALENFTKNHLKVISLLYLVRSDYIRKNVKYNEFKDFYDNYIAKLVDFPIELAYGFGSTIIANGAAITHTFGSDINTYLPESLVKINNQYRKDISLDLKSISEKLSFVWKKLGISAAFLTPLSECLGQKYLSDVLGLNVMIETK